MMRTRTAQTFGRTAQPRRSITPSDKMGRLERPTGRPLWWYEAMLSFGYPFVSMSLLLFNPQISPAGPALQILFALMAAAFICKVRPQDLFRQWSLLLIGMLCTASAIWSVAPDLSAKNGLLVTATVLSGIVLGILTDTRRVISGMFVSFLIYIAASVVFGKYVSLGVHGGVAYAGLNSSKNYFAAAVALLIIITAAYAVSIRNRVVFRWSLVLASLIVSAASLALARSATAVLSSAIAVLFFGVCWSAAALSTQRRMIVIAAALISLAPLAIVAGDIEDAVVGGTLASFGKNAGLTGRGALKESGARIISARPILGRGYYTFWVKGNPPAEDLWARNFITSRYGFNFHNSPTEILVALGWVGFGIISVILCVHGLIIARLVLFRPTLAMAFWAAIGGSVIIRFWTESLFPVPFGIETVLLVAAMAAGRRALADHMPRAISFRNAPMADRVNQ